MHRFVHFMLWGTLLSAGVVLAPGVGAQTRAVVLQSAVWDTREIPVCWENLPDAPLERQGRQWTREAVQETWDGSGTRNYALPDGKRARRRAAVFAFAVPTRAHT